MLATGEMIFLWEYVYQQVSSLKEATDKALADALTELAEVVIITDSSSA